MNLIKTNWSATDVAQLDQYLLTLAKPDRVEWSRRILNTALHLNAVPTPMLRSVAKEIAKGNFLSYLRQNADNYEQMALHGLLLTRLDPLPLLFEQLDAYAARCECWATCDLLQFPVKSATRELWFAKAEQYVHCQPIFVRRIGYDICFPFIEQQEYLPRIFALCELAASPQHHSTIQAVDLRLPPPPVTPKSQNYYVDMAVAWLLAECFTKQHNATLDYLTGSNNLTAFVVNKTVSKCRDSFRVSDADKQMLLSLRK